MTPEAAGGMSRLRTLLPAAAGAVFFIACANVATFLLSRASARSHETSVRVAIGASRGQLAKQLLSDSVLISAAGAAFGMLLAYWVARIVPALFFDQDAEHLVFAPDLAGIVLASAACAAITVACGLVPLFEVRHDRPATVLQRESAGPSKAMRRVRAGLVVAQMAGCCLLVISTGLLLQGFRTALHTSAAHRLGPSVIATLEARQRFSRPDLGLEFFRASEQAALSMPGVSSTALVGTLPGGRPVWQPVRIEPPQLPLRDVEMDVAAFTAALARHHHRSADRRPDVRRRRHVAHVHGRRSSTRRPRATSSTGTPSADPSRTPRGQRVEIIGVVATRRTAKTPAPVPSGAKPGRASRGACPERSQAWSERSRGAVPDGLLLRGADRHADGPGGPRALSAVPVRARTWHAPSST